MGHITSRFERKIVVLTFDKFLGEGEIKLAESPTLIKDEFLPWLQLACCPTSVRHDHDVVKILFKSKSVQNLDTL